MSGDELTCSVTIDARGRGRRRTAVVGLGAVGVAAMAALVWLGQSGDLDAASFATVAATAAWLVGWGSWASPSGGRPASKTMVVALDGGALRLGRRPDLTTRAADVLGSWTDAGGALTIDRRDGVALRLEGLDETARRRIEDALDCGVRHQRATLIGFEHASDRGRGCLQPLAFAGLLGSIVYTPWFYAAARAGELAPLVVLVSLSLLALSTAWLYRARHVVAGRDGLWIPRATGAAYVKLSDLDEVADDHLVLRDGRKVALPAGVTGLAERVRELLASARDTLQGLDADALDRGTRSAEAWIEHLRGLRSGGGYRQRVWSADDLLAVAEDPTRSPERRVAAALAIADVDRDDVGTRLRIAANSSADVDLAAALEAAAESELHEEALSRAHRRFVDDGH